MRSARRTAAVTALLAATSSALWAQWAPPPNSGVRNEFGPLIGGQAAPCRGACGADCPDTCEESSYLECIDEHSYRRVRVLDCRTHRGCREHDDCLDRCSERYWGSVRMPGLTDLPRHVVVEGRPIDRNFYFGECSRTCHEQTGRGYGLTDSWLWKQGRGRSDGNIRFEYTKDSPDGPEEVFRCPEGTHLDCRGPRLRCVPVDEGEEDPVAADAPPIASVVLAADRSCLATGETMPIAVVVRGLEHARVRWSVSGPARLSAGRLEATGNGRAIVTAESLADPQFRDQLEITVGHCGCTFEATLAGDTNRGTVSGIGANFSTRGQATILGGSTSPEALEDLMRITRMTRSGDGELQRQMAQMLERQIAERREQGGATAGSTVGVSLVEVRQGRVGPAAGGGLGTAFKLDVISRATIEPGFSGTLPVDNLVLHTGEFAAEGGAPMLYRWNEGDPGSILLHVSRYDGSWLEGSITAELEGVTGLMKTGGGKPRVQVRADFRAGAFNPLRFENVCAFAQVEAMAE